MINWPTLLIALAAVESSNQPGAHNTDEDARGLYQIRACVVKDLRRIYPDSRWTHADAWNATLSKDMAMLYLHHWCKVYERETGLQATEEVAARIWNGGPSAWRPERLARTDAYWRKVEAKIEWVEAARKGKVKE